MVAAYYSTVDACSHSLPAWEMSPRASPRFIKYTMFRTISNGYRKKILEPYTKYLPRKIVPYLPLVIDKNLRGISVASQGLLC